MTIKIEGDLTQIKQYMKARRSKMASRIRQIERKHNNWRNVSPREQDEMYRLKRQIRVYSISETIPARLENGLVINGKLLQQFMKKLRNYHFEFELGEHQLTLHYRDIFTKSNGKLELTNMAKWFGDVKDDLPTLKIDHI